MIPDHLPSVCVCIYTYTYMFTVLARVGRIDTRALFEGSSTDTPGVYSIFEFSCMLRPSRTNFFGMGMCSHVLCSSMLLIRV